MNSANDLLVVPLLGKSVQQLVGMNPEITELKDSLYAELNVRRRPGALQGVSA
jgi:hypothetical protein